MIRPVRPEDADGIATIYNEYVKHTTVSFETAPVTPDEMRRRIEYYAAHFPYLVDEEAGVIRGYCYAHAWKEREAYRFTWETTVYLSKQYCRMGIGKKLMQELIKHCKSAGCHALVACITGNNTASCEFHRSLGFTPCSRFPEVGYKFGKWLDVVDYLLLL